MVLLRDKADKIAIKQGLRLKFFNFNWIKVMKKIITRIGLLLIISLPSFALNSQDYFTSKIINQGRFGTFQIKYPRVKGYPTQLLKNDIQLWTTYSSLTIGYTPAVVAMYRVGVTPITSDSPKVSKTIIN